MSLPTTRRTAARRTLAALTLLAACAAPTAPPDRLPTIGARRILLDAAPKDTTPPGDSTGVGTNGGGYIDPDI
jgi:hypothetical protein